jgi:hypothetical protein
LILRLVRVREIVLLIRIILLLVRRIIYKSLYQALVSILVIKRIIVIIILSLDLVASCWLLSLIILKLLFVFLPLLLVRRSLPNTYLVFLFVSKVISLYILARGIFILLYRDYILSISSTILI